MRRVVHVALVCLIGATGASCGGGLTPTTPTTPASPTPASTSSTTGRAIDAISAGGLAGVSYSGASIAPGSSDASGGFTMRGLSGASDPQLIAFTNPAIVERRTNVRVPGPDTTVSLISTAFDLPSFNEMFRVAQLQRWTTAPPLMIETRVLQFTSTSVNANIATIDEMTAAEVAGLADDLTWALPQLTGGRFTAFASVAQQTSAAGASVPILVSGRITVARYVGLTAATSYWGYSRWQTLSDGTVTAGTMMLDVSFERSGSIYRRSLRAHELGHNLGYNHVTLRASVMNSAARLEPNDFDRQSALIAFQRPPGNRAPDTDPTSFSTNVNRVATWGPPIH